jgi:hypothetical protein
MLFDAPSTVFASYSLQDVDDRSILGGATNRNVTHTLLASWAQSFQSPLNLATTLLYNQANVGGNSISILSLTETVSYSFFEGKLSSALTGGINLINSNGSDTQLTGNLSASYHLGSYGTISLNISANSYNSTTTAPTFVNFKAFFNIPSDFNKPSVTYEKSKHLNTCCADTLNVFFDGAIFRRAGFGATLCDA